MLSRLLIDEFEDALQSGSIATRTQWLRRITDLFLGQAASYSPEQVSLFNDVMSRLAADIETKVLAELSTRLAPIANAPAGVIRRLAQDDDIVVSGPLLRHSERLSDDDLIDVAKKKSQQHLLEISRRLQLS